MRAEHALGSAGPDESDTFRNLLRRDAEALCKCNRIGKRSEAAREVVSAAISLCLADHCDDLGRIDLAVINQTLQSGNIIGAIHWELVYANPQSILPVTRTIMIRLQF